MHGDEKYRRLSQCPPCGQALWWQLLAGRQTGIIPGICVIGEAAFAEQLGWTLKGFREAFQEVFREGMAEADWRSHLVWVRNGLKYNPPANPNVVKSWKETWLELPECSLKDKARQHVKDFLKGLGKGFQEAFDKFSGNPLPNPSRNPSPNQEQEQEQEQEQDNSCGENAADQPTDKTRKPRKRDDLFDAIVRLTGSDPIVSGSHIGRVCSALRKADPPYTAAEVLLFPDSIRKRGLDFTITVGSIQKYIGWVRDSTQPATKGKKPISSDDIAHGEYDGQVGFRFGCKTCRNPSCTRPGCVAEREDGYP